MKICLITRECFPFEHGGIGTAFYSLGKMLANLGHEVILLTKKPASFNEQIYSQHYTKNFKAEWVQYSEGAFSIHYLLDYSFQLEKHFERFNSSFRADLVLYAEFDGGAYFLLKEKNKGKYPNTPFVIHFSGPLFAVWEAEKRIATLYEDIIFKMEEYCIKASSFAIAPSSFILNYLKQKFNLQQQQHFIIPNPINNTIFNEPVPPSFKDVEPEKKILYIGRLQKIKGIDYLLTAFRQLIETGYNEPVRLQLVGKDIFWNDLNMTFKKYCKVSLPANIFSKIDFIGHISQSEMLAYHKQAWVAVFPSRFETFGNVSLECMYSGIPVIINKNTGSLEVTGTDYDMYWDEETGVNGLTIILQKVLADPSLRNELAQNSYKRAMELHTRLPGYFENAFKKITTAGYDRLSENHDKIEQLFLLFNQYSIFCQQKKNEELKTAYKQKDEELKKVWESYDNKNQQLATLWQKHEEQIREIWNKYDAKDSQLLDVWKQHDEKEALVNSLREQLNQLQIDHEKLTLQLATLTRDIEKHIASPAEITMPLNEDILPEIELLYKSVKKMKGKNRRFF